LEGGQRKKHLGKGMGALTTVVKVRFPEENIERIQETNNREARTLLGGKLPELALGITPDLYKKCRQVMAVKGGGRKKSS